ncbi:MAG: M20/M25/M40 family metallo-hydrolase [Kordiimonadaceae bacterium]|nr:M20/M25/M40 family metallo-hydrolase [Kordiimonadaceae bacterium]
MRVLKYIVGAILLLVAVMVGRTLVLVPGGAAKTLKIATLDAAETNKIAANLATAIRIKTVSYGLDTAPDDAEFKAFHAFLETTYPAAHAALRKEIISGYSLMYRWPAAAANPPKKPIALLAHMDVVPVPAAGVSNWTEAPFAGVIDSDGNIWGRGTVDNKGSVIALMETAERLAKSGFQPDRDIYFLFGHDEELGGGNGAAVMAKLLQDRGVQLAWVLDEGSAIAIDIVPGIKSPLAGISLGEKGSVTLKFSAKAKGGHSSAPASSTAASLAAKAGVAVMDNPYPYVLDSNLEAMLLAAAPELPFVQRIAMANMWLTRPLLKQTLAKSQTVAAFMHTTTAFTMMQSGTKSNILPQYGEAIVNYRIHPRDTVESVVARATEIIASDQVEVTRLGGRNATSMSSVDGEGYLTIADTIREEFGDIPVIPTLTVQATDSRHYGMISDGVYRFGPLVVGPEDLQRIHGTNEHIHKDAFARQVDFFEKLLKRAAN